MLDIIRRRPPMSFQRLAIGLALLTWTVPVATSRAQTAPPPVPESTQAPMPQWYGVMDTGGREFRFVLEREPGDAADTAHHLRSLDEGERRFPLDNFHVGDRLEFELKLTGAKYSGQLDADGQSATGKWSQRGSEFNLTFHKVDAVPADTSVEVWGGTLNAILQKLELHFRVYSDDDGKKTVRLDSITQKVGGFLGSLSIHDDTWDIEVPILGGAFSGQISADGRELAGRWKQSGMSFDLKLNRLDPDNLPSVSAPRRPQTPQPPFPYEVHEVAFENTTDQVTLAGVRE
jgi:hypothetical protein